VGSRSCNFCCDYGLSISSCAIFQAGQCIFLLYDKTSSSKNLLLLIRTSEAYSSFAVVLELMGTLPRPECWDLGSFHPCITQCAWQRDKPSWSAAPGSVGSQQLWRAEHGAAGGLRCGRAARAAPELHPGQPSPFDTILLRQILWAKPINYLPQRCGDLQQAQFK